MLHCTVHQKRKRKVLLNQFFARLQLSDESWRDCVGDDEAVLCVFPVQLLCMQHQHESGEWRKMKEPVNWTVRADHGCPRCQIHVIPVTYWLVGCRVGGDKLTSCLDQSSNRTPTKNSWAEWIKFHIYQSSWAGQMWAVSEVRVVLCFINKLQCRLGGGRGSGQASLVVTTSWKWSCHEILTSTEI